MIEKILVLTQLECSPLCLWLLFLDEKEKYDPVTFADQIVSGLNEAQGDLEQVKAPY